MGHSCPGSELQWAEDQIKQQTEAVGLQLFAQRTGFGLGRDLQINNTMINHTNSQLGPSCSTACRVVERGRLLN